MVGNPECFYASRLCAWKGRGSIEVQDLCMKMYEDEDEDEDEDRSLRIIREYSTYVCI